MWGFGVDTVLGPGIHFFVGGGCRGGDNRIRVSPCKGGGCPCSVHGVQSLNRSLSKRPQKGAIFYEAAVIFTQMVF